MYLHSIHQIISLYCGLSLLIFSIFISTKSSTWLSISYQSHLFALINHSVLIYFLGGNKNHFKCFWKLFNGDHSHQPTLSGSLHLIKMCFFALLEVLGWSMSNEVIMQLISRTCLPISSKHLCNIGGLKKKYWVNMFVV
jgi:hypothetical protein